VTHIKTIVSILPHEAKTILWLVCLYSYNTNVLQWSCDKYNTEKDNILGLKVSYGLTSAS